MGGSEWIREVLKPFKSDTPCNNNRDRNGEVCPKDITISNQLFPLFFMSSLKPLLLRPPARIALEGFVSEFGVHLPLEHFNYTNYNQDCLIKEQNFQDCILSSPVTGQTVPF